MDSEHLKREVSLSTPRGYPTLAFRRAGSPELARTGVKHRPPNSPAWVPSPGKALGEWGHTGVCTTFLCQNWVSLFIL